MKVPRIPVQQDPELKSKSKGVKSTQIEISEKKVVKTTTRQKLNYQPSEDSLLDVDEAAAGIQFYKSIMAMDNGTSKIRKFIVLYKEILEHMFANSGSSCFNEFSNKRTDPNYILDLQNTVVKFPHALISRVRDAKLWNKERKTIQDLNSFDKMVEFKEASEPCKREFCAVAEYVTNPFFSNSLSETMHRYESEQHQIVEALMTHYKTITGPFNPCAMSSRTTSQMETWAAVAASVA